MIYATLLKIRSKLLFVLLMLFWLLGKRIAEEELKGEGRAEYGMKLVENLSKSLSENYGNGFTKRSLYKYLQFY